MALLSHLPGILLNIPLIYCQEIVVLSTYFYSWEFLICIAQYPSDTCLPEGFECTPWSGTADKLLLSKTSEAFDSNIIFYHLPVLIGCLSKESR